MNKEKYAINEGVLYKIVNLYNPYTGEEEGETAIEIGNVKSILGENKKLKHILKNIETIIESCYKNTGRNEDNFEYIVNDCDIENIINLIPNDL